MLFVFSVFKIQKSEREYISFSIHKMETNFSVHPKEFMFKSKSNNPFKERYTFEERKHVANQVMAKYPDRLPIIVHRVNSTIPDIEKHKFLVPKDITMGKFLYEIRKHIELKPTQAIFMFVNDNIIPPINALVSETYDKYKDPDGFLYITYNGENTFG